MRTIKFRAWDKKRKEMLLVGQIDWGFKGVEVIYQEEDGLTLMPFRSFREIILQQFTGLKDKNDKEIYESDLVIWDGQRQPVEVFWKRQAWYPFINNTTKVVGNIYENTELLKVK